jgi:hypothetical protein
VALVCSTYYHVPKACTNTAGRSEPFFLAGWAESSTPDFGLRAIAGM